MKTLLILIHFALLSTAVLASEYESRTGLYVKDEYNLLDPNQIPEILEKIHQESPRKNIILYIHGRGRDTKDEWSQITTIEERFNSRIIMFHWPSWKNLITRPVENAKKAAVEFDETMKQIKDFKDSHPEMFENKKLSLLVHSMGHIVLKEYVEKFYNYDLMDVNGLPLFDSFVSTGADVGFTDHRAWFSKINFAAKKFVTMNKRDLVLLLSYLLDLKVKNPLLYKLGLGIDRFPIKKEFLTRYLDPTVTYIDLSRSLNTDHRYFESNKPLMQIIFRPILKGEAFKPDELGVKYKKEYNIYYVTN